MRSCAEFSAPCSCLTVVAAEATWTGADPGVGAGPGPAVTAVQAPGSVFTVAAEKHTRGIDLMNSPFTTGVSFGFVLGIDEHFSGQCGLGDESGDGGGGSLSPCARGRAREGDAWQAGLVVAPAPAAPGVKEEEEAVLETGPFDTTTHTHTHERKWINGPLDAE